MITLAIRIIGDVEQLSSSTGTSNFQNNWRQKIPETGRSRHYCGDLVINSRDVARRRYQRIYAIKIGFKDIQSIIIRIHGELNPRHSSLKYIGNLHRTVDGLRRIKRAFSLTGLRTVKRVQ